MTVPPAMPDDPTVDDDPDMTGETSPTGRAYVYVRKPRCPECGSGRLHGYGTQANGDGTTTRYADCRDCGRKLLIVKEYFPGWELGWKAPVRFQQTRKEPTMTPVYLESLGHIACTAGVPVSEVRRILAEIGARPAFVINAVPHFAAEVAGTVIARAQGWTNLAAYARRYDEEIKGNA